MKTIKKVIERIITNNGYGCQCCSHDDESVEWIDEENMLQPEAIIDELFSNHAKISDFHIITHLYEKDGEILYGYECDSYGRAGENKVFYFSATHKIQVTNCTAKKGIIVDIKKLKAML